MSAIYDLTAAAAMLNDHNHPIGLALSLVGCDRRVLELGCATGYTARLLVQHLRHGQLATLTATRPPSRYGVLDLQPDGQIGRFREKMQTDWINGGFFVFNRRMFDYLDLECVLEQQPLERLAADGQLMGYRHEGFWIGMDTYREYEMLNQLWDVGQAPWKVWA